MQVLSEYLLKEWMKECVRPGEGQAPAKITQELGQGKQVCQARSLEKSVTKGCMSPSRVPSSDLQDDLWSKGDMGGAGKDERQSHSRG